MKKNLPRFACFAAFILLVADCSSSDAHRLFPSVRTYRVERAIFLHQDNIEGPAANFKMTLAEPADAGPLQKLVRERLYGGKSPEDYAESVCENYARDYRKTAGELEASAYSGRVPGQSGEGYDGPLDFYEDVSTEVLAVSERLLSLSVYREAYRGGAHGSHSLAYTVVDLAGEKKLGLADLFVPGSEAKLEDLIVGRLRSDRGLAADAPLTSTGFFLEDRIGPTENFALLPEGLEFLWNEYEVAAYVAGPIRALLSYEEIAPYLTTQAKSLLSSAFTPKSPVPQD